MNWTVLDLSVSHDLQEPLRKILIFNDLISNSLASADMGTVRGHLEKIKKATGRMQVLINDLLSYSASYPNGRSF